MLSDIDILSNRGRPKKTKLMTILTLRFQFKYERELFIRVDNLCDSIYNDTHAYSNNIRGFKRKIFQGICPGSLFRLRWTGN